MRELFVTTDVRISNPTKQREFFRSGKNNKLTLWPICRSTPLRVGHTASMAYKTFKAQTRPAEQECTKNHIE